MVQSLVLIIMILLISIDLEFLQMSIQNQNSYVLATWLFGEPIRFDGMFMWRNEKCKVIMVPNNSMPIQLYCRMDLFNYDELDRVGVEVSLEALKTRLAGLSSKNVCYCLGSEQICIKDVSCIAALEKIVNLPIKTTICDKVGKLFQEVVV